MKRFRYEGLTETGQPLSGSIEAPDKIAALEKAREQCRVITGLEPEFSGNLADILHTDIGLLLSGGKIPHKKLAILCAQMHIQLKAGMPLVRALELAARNAPDALLQKLLTDSARDVRVGTPLADAFQRHGPGLPPAFIALIRAGELSGTLEDSFDRLRQHHEDAAGTAAKAGSALVYPALLICVAIIVVCVIMVYAVPVFQKSFAALGSDLPLPTRILMGISGFLSDHLALLIALAAFLAMGILMLRKSPRWAPLFARAALAMPILGPVNRMRSAASFSATLSALIAAGIPLTDALAIAGESVENLLLRQDIHTACRLLSEGRSLTQGLGESSRFPELLREMVSLGEETGNLEQTLQVVSGYYRAEVSTAVKRALDILEPAITLALAALVIFILLSVYLPIFGLYGAI